ncbi:MAG: hypothetical protein V9E94_00340 [Microthrixaceae bacterium]
MGIAARVRSVALDQPPTLGDGDCEALREGWLGQPVNTLTSVGYVTVGAWLGARSARLPRDQRPSAVTYAGLVALTGIGSIAYHGPQFPGAQMLHDAPIFAAAAVGAAVPLSRIVRGREALPGWSNRAGVAIGACGALGLVAYTAGRTGSPLCRPESVLQPHGLWHLATAAVIGLWGTVIWSPGTAADG